MNEDIFKSMQVPGGARAHVLNPPTGYPYDPAGFTFHQQGNDFDFVQVFVTDASLFAQTVAEGEKLTRDGGLLWASLPNQVLKNGLPKEDVSNKAAPLGLKPTQWLPLDNQWTAVQLERS